MLKHTLQQDFFTFNKKIYKQISGLSVSPILAEIFLNNLESNYISTHHLFSNVFYWKRYVDDIFCIFTGSLSDLSNFIKFLNSLHSNIKFTHELHHEGTLPFLDLNINLHANKLSFNIYRKPTTTDHLIPFFSNHPLEHKLAAFNSFFHRLFNIPLSPTAFTQEYNTIFTLAKINNYPYSLIVNLYNKKLFQFNIKNLTALIPPLDTNSYFSLPFFNPTSYNTKTFLNNCSNDSKIKISFKTLHNLKSIFVKKIDSINVSQKSGIYKLICSCNKFYIGRTFRSIDQRTKEHFKLIASSSIFDPNPTDPSKSAFAQHVIDSLHSYNRKPIILQTCESNHTTDIIEKIFISESLIKNPHLLLNDTTYFSNLKILPLLHKKLSLNSQSLSNESRT